MLDPLYFEVKSFLIQIIMILNVFCVHHDHYRVTKPLIVLVLIVKNMESSFFENVRIYSTWELLVLSFVTFIMMIKKEYQQYQTENGIRFSKGTVTTAM